MNGYNFVENDERQEYGDLLKRAVTYYGNAVNAKQQGEIGKILEETD